MMMMTLLFLHSSYVVGRKTPISFKVEITLDIHTDSYVVGITIPRVGFFSAGTITPCTGFRDNQDPLLKTTGLPRGM